MDNSGSTQFLTRPDGRVAYEVSGEGPLVVCIPAMADLRATYRFLTPALIAAGFRVAVSDLRGHGDSDTTFAEYGDEATAGDISALIDALADNGNGEPVFVVGNSMGAASGVLAAARPLHKISGLVLMAPFVREPPHSEAMHLLMRAMLDRHWAANVWAGYLPRLYAGRKPADYDAYRDSVISALKRPGHARAFSLTTRIGHAAAAQALSTVAVPALIVMGEADPDFKDPNAEAKWIAEQLSGRTEIVMVPDAGHFPQSQQPEIVADAVVAFLRRTLEEVKLDG